MHDSGDVRRALTQSLRRYDARANTFYRIRATHVRAMRKALAALVAVARAALDPLLPAASPWTLSTRRRWTRSRVTRRIVFEGVVFWTQTERGKSPSPKESLNTLRVQIRLKNFEKKSPQKERERERERERDITMDALKAVVKT